MEVTPEFNFEEPSEYDGEEQETYGQETDELDDYEEQISYRNGYSKTMTNSGMFYEDKSIISQESPRVNRLSYPKPPALHRIPQFTSTPTLAKPKVSISSLLGKLKADKQKSLDGIPTLRPQLARRGVRPNPIQPRSTMPMSTSSIKVERMEGRQEMSSNMISRKILMKVPPTKPSGETNGPTQKHKIGMSKCRLIVESIERELETALQEIKVRVAAEIGVPIQVVQGVWQIKHKITKVSN